MGRSSASSSEVSSDPLPRRLSRSRSDPLEALPAGDTASAPKLRSRDPKLRSREDARLSSRGDSGTRGVPAVEDAGDVGMTGRPVGDAGVTGASGSSPGARCS